MGTFTNDTIKDYRQQGVQAQEYQDKVRQQKLSKWRSKQEIDPITGQPQVIGMSGYDPLLGFLTDTYLGGKVVKGVAKGVKNLLSPKINQSVLREFESDVHRNRIRTLAGDNYYHGTYHRFGGEPRSIYGGNKFFLSYGEPWAERRGAKYIIEFPAKESLPQVDKFGLKTGYDVKQVYRQMRGIEPRTIPEPYLKNMELGQNQTVINSNDFKQFLQNGTYKVYTSPTPEYPFGKVELYMSHRNGGKMKNKLKIKKAQFGTKLSEWVNKNSDYIKLGLNTLSGISNTIQQNNYEKALKEKQKQQYNLNKQQLFNQAYNEALAKGKDPSPIVNSYNAFQAANSYVEDTTSSLSNNITNNITDLFSGIMNKLYRKD